MKRLALILAACICTTAQATDTTPPPTFDTAYFWVMAQVVDGDCHVRTVDCWGDTVYVPLYDAIDAMVQRAMLENCPHVDCASDTAKPFVMMDRTDTLCRMETTFVDFDPKVVDPEIYCGDVPGCGEVAVPDRTTPPEKRSYLWCWRWFCEEPCQ